MKTIPRHQPGEQMAGRVEAVYGTEIDFERFRDRKQQYYEAQFAKEGVPVKPGLRELLAFLKEQRIPMAVDDQIQAGLYGTELKRDRPGGVF